MKRVLVLACLMAAGAVQAQEKSGREAEQLRRLRQQVQQLQQQFSSEQQKSQQAQSEARQARDGATAEVEQANEALRAARSRAQSVQARVSQLERELGDLRVEHAEQSRQFTDARRALDERTRVASETGQRLQKSENDLAGFKAQLSHAQTGLQQCSARNAALFALGNEVIDRFEQRTLGERVGQGEPFLQMGRVRLENLAEGYRDRLQEQVPTPSEDRALQ